MTRPRSGPSKVSEAGLRPDERTTRHSLPEAWRRGLYETIVRRRDMRSFLPDPVPPETLARILWAAHHAGSVGFSQPWNFLVIEDVEIRRKVRAHVEAERLRAADGFDGERREKYLSFKLEGILDAPINLCVTCDPKRFGPAVIGRNTIPQTALYSTCGAVQNLWLAARAEGVGVGWVSILQPDALRKILGIPEPIVPVAYLCVGFVESFPERPALEAAGWLTRLPLQDVVFHDLWAEPPSAEFLETIAANRIVHEPSPMTQAVSGDGVAIPRIVIAGTGSGVGKTTVTVGLARALRRRGLRVAVFKCGPDYLDPTYHARAAGVPCHNLDGWMMGRDAVVATFARGAQGADIALIEGVMGLFDGASPNSDEGSTAEVAKWLGAPVLLVCDASGMARTIAAIGRGFADFDADLQLAGLVCNRIGSRGHLDLLRRATGEPRIVGGLLEEAALSFPERHLGLRTADEEAVPDGLFDAWGEHVAQWLDVDEVLAIARAAPSLPEIAARVQPVREVRCRIGLAFDEAFHFYYDDNLRRLETFGAELVRFSPIRDRRLPDVDGLYFGGGYPEAHAEALSGNISMLADVATFAATGGPIYGECGGLMYLSRGLRTRDGRLHAMVGLVPAEAQMRDRLQALGYVEVETQGPTVLGPPGLRFRGHQFRYSDLQLQADMECAYAIRRRRGGETLPEGYRIGNTLASYVHVHWASNPLAAQGFVESCVGHARRVREASKEAPGG